MRRLFTILSCLLIGIYIFAQKDVTKFLGIPVDGPKSEMITKLKAKEFTLKRVGGSEVLNGRFNGVDVNVYISTENGNVARIMVCDAEMVDETNIKIRFNNLCRQFNNNGKYMRSPDFTISEGEDISYEMLVNNKRYEAIFYQLPEGKTIKDIQEELLSQIKEIYTPEQYQNLTDEEQTKLIAEYSLPLLDKPYNRPVWFIIAQEYDKYYITMFYDNEYNRAQGQDL